MIEIAGAMGAQNIVVTVFAAIATPMPREAPVTNNVRPASDAILPKLL